MRWLWWNPERQKDIPQWAYRVLVTELGIPNDALSDLLCYERNDLINGVPRTLISIFNPSEARRAGARDFAGLDRHPGLILFEGWHDPESGENHLEIAAARNQQIEPLR